MARENAKKKKKRFLIYLSAFPTHVRSYFPLHGLDLCVVLWVFPRVSGVILDLCHVLCRMKAEHVCVLIQSVCYAWGVCTCQIFSIDSLTH